MCDAWEMFREKACYEANSKNEFFLWVRSIRPNKVYNV